MNVNLAWLARPSKNLATVLLPFCLTGCELLAPRIDQGSDVATLLGYARMYFVHSTYAEIERVDERSLGGLYGVKLLSQTQTKPRSAGCRAAIGGVAPT